MLELDKRSPSLTSLVSEDAELTRVAGGLGFTEGPVWRGDHLLFSDIPNHRIVRWRALPEGPELTTFGLGNSNGLTLDLQGRLIAAEHYGRKVSAIAEDASRTTLVERYENGRLNSPNDLVVRSDGSIYFTDPPYGVRQTPPGQQRPANWWSVSMEGKEQPHNGVYRLDPDGTLALLVADFLLPNGIAFSPDQKTLYVDDSQARHIRAFDVQEDGTLTGSRVVLEISSTDDGVPDGMTVDLEGNVFCTGPGGVWVCRPDGEFLGRIIPPEVPANLAWGEDGSVLFLTARASVYRAPDPHARGAAGGLSHRTPPEGGSPAPEFLKRGSGNLSDRRLRRVSHCPRYRTPGSIRPNGSRDEDRPSPPSGPAHWARHSAAPRGSESPRPRRARRVIPPVSDLPRHGAERPA
jgi:gluconolactonase